MQIKRNWNMPDTDGGDIRMKSVDRKTKESLG